MNVQPLPKSIYVPHCRVALHEKKVSSLIGKLLKREVGLSEAEKTPLGEPEKVVLREPEKDLLESALTQMDKFREEVSRSVSCSFCPVFVDKKTLPILKSECPNIFIFSNHNTIHPYILISLYPLGSPVVWKLEYLNIFLSSYPLFSKSHIPPGEVLLSSYQVIIS